MDEPKRALDWICQIKSSARPPASTPADTWTKSRNQAEWFIDDCMFALDLAEQAQNIAEVAAFVKPAAALLQMIIDALDYDISSDSDHELKSESVEAGAKRKHQTNMEKEPAVKKPRMDVEDPYKEWKDVDGMCLLARHVANMTGDICAIVLRLQETDHSDQIGRLMGGTGGPGGAGDAIGGVGGTGSGPIVNFMTQTEEKLEKWLQFPPDMKQKQHDTVQLWVEGTSQWFLDDKRFIAWEDNPGVLWVEGPSGAGKSVIR
ncbi:ANK-REP-REGION domain-containing protein [Mycena sanguinolenta]|uniref:ANK-REP-REGION domain-containing protein n=1 Tax=Mycena sanguinolenta TaxID=230812 RepID=A0A8H6WXW0_9AGAR|nr:ANK-REP-REGION domain-containing protein [Mycena sanguinolenta]